MKRRKFTSKFKTAVVLESLKERSSLSELAIKYQLQPNQISLWKKDFKSKAETVFETSIINKKTATEEREEELLRIIGQLKVENEFLKKKLK